MNFHSFLLLQWDGARILVISIPPGVSSSSLWFMPAFQGLLQVCMCVWQQWYLIIVLAMTSCVPRSMALSVLEAFYCFIATFGAWGSFEGLCFYLDIPQSHLFLRSYFFLVLLESRKHSLSSLRILKLLLLAFPSLCCLVSENMGGRLSILSPKSVLGWKT